MFGLLLLFAGIQVSAAEPARRAVPYVAVLGGAGPTFGSMTAFTQATPSSARAQDTRSFGTAGSVGLRTGIWVPDSAWGMALEGSRLTMPVPGGGLEAWALDWFLLARPAAWASRRIFPYAGLGFGRHLLRARGDFRPATAAALESRRCSEQPGCWTFDARLGLQARMAARLFLLAEAKLTRFAMSHEWQPWSWLGPAPRYREGLRAEALPVVFQIGAAAEF